MHTYIHHKNISHVKKLQINWFSFSFSSRPNGFQNISYVFVVYEFKGIDKRLC